MNSVLTMKKITTIMDLVGMCLAAVCTVSAVILLICSTGLVGDSADYLENGSFSELTGGFEVLGGLFALGGSILAVVFIALMLFAAIALLAACAVPAIHGIWLQKNTKKHLETGHEVYRRYAVRDSVIKLVCNGIPVLCFLYAMLDAGSPFAIGIMLWFAVICGLEICVLCRLKKDGER